MWLIFTEHLLWVSLCSKYSALIKSSVWAYRVEVIIGIKHQEPKSLAQRFKQRQCFSTWQSLFRKERPVWTAENTDTGSDLGAISLGGYSTTHNFWQSPKKSSFQSWHIFSRNAQTQSPQGNVIFNKQTVHISREYFPTYNFRGRAGEADKILKIKSPTMG